MIGDTGEDTVMFSVALSLSVFRFMSCPEMCKREKSDKSTLYHWYSSFVWISSL
jgi:hypothetical protein